MRFLFDEGLPNRLATFLRDNGHDVAICGHGYPLALADRDIPAIAHCEQRILLTNDKQFGDLVFRDQLPHSGIILFRVGYLSIDDRIARLTTALTRHRDQLDLFIVISCGSTRVAKQPKR